MRPAFHGGEPPPPPRPRPKPQFRWLTEEKKRNWVPWVIGAVVAAVAIAAFLF